MEKQLISFETAKLAKEKGFDEAPTQSLIQKWLREKHGIALLCDIDTTLSWYYKILPLHELASYTGEFIRSKYVYQRYEDCLENGLIETLQLIKI